MNIFCFLSSSPRLLSLCGLLAIVAVAIVPTAVALTTNDQFGDWALHCDDVTQTCSMSQVAAVEDSGETLMQINFVFDLSASSKLPKAVFVLPLGTALDTPPKLYIANGYISKLSVQYCLNDGCYFSIPLDPVMFERFLAMYTGYVEVQSKFGEAIKIPISGAGSRAAFNFYRERF